MAPIMAAALERSRELTSGRRDRSRLQPPPVERGGSLRTLVADLEDDPSVVSLMLSMPPDEASDGAAEVTVGLRAALPVIVWSREDCDSEEFLTAARYLLHDDGTGDVLQRLRMLRTAAYQSDAAHVGHHLVLMWDDPERPVGL